MLHITNGDSTVFGLRDSGLPGEFLAWRDPLHDGPVPHAASLPELSDIRAGALSGFGWGSFDEIRASYTERDAALTTSGQHEEIVLWFEHDLYDQLQLLQLLDWFHSHPNNAARVSLIQIASHPEVTPFYGLGQLSGSQLAALFPARTPLAPDQLEAASEKWEFFTSPSHEQLEGLPRLLEEYPATGDGLSRMQRQLLLSIAEGPCTWPELYAASQRFEESPWGDTSVALRLATLCEGSTPAIHKTAQDRFETTPHGRALLAGKSDWAASNGVDFWLGGVHLSGRTPAWRWDRVTQRLVRGSTGPRTGQYLE